MPGAAIGALLGFGMSGALAAAGITTIFGMSVGTLWLLGASLGSLFDVPDLDLGSTTPNYSFGPLSNTKSQLLPIPIVYGKCRVAGNIFLQQFDTDERKVMNMMVGVSAGEINKISSVYADEHVLYDEAMNTYTYWIWKMVRERGEEGTYTTVGDWVQVEYASYLAYEGRKEIRDINGNVVTVKILEGCSCNVYTGTATQNADSREPDGNTYPNLAYVALTLKAQEGLSGNPVITSIVEGKKVWTPSGTVFSRNPAWIVYDLLTDAVNGVGIPTAHIDLDSFETAAAYCDELVDGEPRYTLDYIIDSQRPAVDHLAAMLACFGGYFIPRDKIELHIERSSTVYKELNPDNFVKGSFSWWQKSNDDSPNRITIEWIDPDNHYEQTAAVFEWQEDIQARGLYEKSVSLLGITRSAQVGRMGKYMLETAKLVQNFCSFAVSTQDADIEAGEVVSLTYPDFTGWNAKPFRVISVQDDGQTGNVLITCAEYVASLYDDSQIPVAVPVNPNPPVTTDDVYNLILEDIGAFNADGTWVPVIKASWQNPSDYTPKEINVRYRYQGTEAWTFVLNTTSTLTSANLTNLTTGENVEVWVNCKRPNGTHTPGDVAVIVVGADTTAPSAPTGLSATGWFGNINLNWANPTDPDLSHIEIWENSVDDRDTAVKIAEVKGTSYQRYLGSFVVRYYWVRAVDRTGNISGYNALAGTAGNSDQENHQDFVDLVLQENPYLNTVQTDLNTGIEKISLDEELVAQGLIDAMLNAREGKQESDVAIALAKRELSTKIVEGLSAEASERLLLAAIVGSNTAAIQSEATARSDADSALASQITTLQGAVGDNTAAIQSEATARANADDALSSTISTVSATANAKNKTYRQASAPTSGMTAGDLWFDSDANNKVYRYSGSSWVATDDTRIAANTAAIQTEQTARADGDSAIASQVTTLQTTTVGGTVTESASAPSSPTAGQVYYNTTSKKYFRWSGTAWVEVKGIEGHSRSAIQVINESVDGIKGKHAVKIDTNGYVTGYELIGTGASSAMVFHVDNFLIGKPGASNDYPFALGTVDGVTRISMKNVFIQDASIKTLKIENNAVTTYVFITGGGTASWGYYYGTGTPTWRDLPANNSVTITEVVSGRPAMITFSVNWYSAEDYGGTSFRVLANTTPSISGATVIWSKNVGGGDQINMSYTEQFQWNPSSSGTWYLYIQWLLGSSGDYDTKWNTYIRSHSLSLFHMKR